MTRSTRRILTLRELNRALLDRQLLLRRRRLAVVDAVERLAGLQAQWPPSPYVALWTRLQRFERDDLMAALEQREVVKATLMRMTLHIVSAADYLHFAAALKERRLRALAARARRADPKLDLVRFARETLRAAGDGPFRRRELVPAASGNDVRGSVHWHAVKLHGNLVDAPGSASWRGSGEAGPYVAAKAWLGREPGDERTGGLQLVRRYLAAYGPATMADLAYWSGLPRDQLAAAIAALEPLRRFRDESGRELIDLRGAPLPRADVPAPVRFLARWDAALLGYAPPERQRILPETIRKTVIRNNGDVYPSVLVDGFVSAVWKVDKTRGLQIEPLRRLTKSERRGIDAEGERLAAFLQL
jgi:hypothetical protein